MPNERSRQLKDIAQCLVDSLPTDIGPNVNRARRWLAEGAELLRPGAAGGV